MKYCEQCKSPCYHAGKSNPHMDGKRNRCKSHPDEKPRSGGQTVEPDELDLNIITWTFN